MDDLWDQVSQHRRQRAAWHASLDRFLDREITESELYEAERDEHQLPPDIEPAAPSALWEAE